MAKVYFQIINLCPDCPHFLFYYNNCHILNPIKSGHNINYQDKYVCCAVNENREPKIICFPQDLVTFSKKIFEWKKSQKTLFPMSNDERPKNPYEIPEWCPLTDYQKDDLK
jgi:hypothetical protein